MFGLKQKYIDYIQDACEQFPHIEKVAVFGSRAMGNYKPCSDIDLVIFGVNLDESELSKLNMILNEEKPIPFFLDTVHYKTIKSAELLKHIDNESHVIYTCDVFQKV